MAQRPAWKWDAFISYAQARDRTLARALRNGLQSFGKAPFALRRMRVFLDKSALPASSDLPRALREALRDSRMLLVICSPEAAQSPWVALEVKTFLETHEARDVLLVRAAGRLSWRGGAFHPGETDALPEPLCEAFSAEPLWVDVAWSRESGDPAHSSLLRGTIAQLAAAILDLPLDEIEGDDVRSQRVLRRLRAGAIGVLAALTVLSVTLAYWAEVNRGAAERQRTVAMQRALAMSAQAAVTAPPSFANAQSAAAYAVTVAPSARGPGTWSAAFAALQSLPVAVVSLAGGVSAAAFAPRDRTFAVASGSEASLRDRTGTQIWSRKLAHEVAALAWTPSGRLLLAVGPSRQVTMLGRDGTVLRSLSWPGAVAGGDTPRAVVRAVTIPREDRGGIVSADGLVLLDLAKLTAEVGSTSIGEMTICGTSVAWAHSDGFVLVQDIVADREPRQVHRHRAQVTTLACSAHGASVASVGADDEVLWTRGSNTSRTQFHGVRQIALDDTGRRLAIRTSAVQQSLRLDAAHGVNQVLVFADQLQEPIWRRDVTTFPSALRFHGAHLLIANDQVELLRVNVGSTRRQPFDRLAERDQIDHLVGLSTPGRALLVTKTGRIQEVDFVAGTRRPLGRTTGWATRLLISDDRESALLLSRIEGAEAEDQREVAILAATNVAPGPIHFQRARDTAALPGGSEILAVVPGDGSSSTVSTTALEAPPPVHPPIVVAGAYESLDLSADGAHMILHGEAGAVLVSRGDGVAQPIPDSGATPEFIGAGAGVLLRSESPEVIRLPDSTRTSLPFDTGNVGSVGVTADLRFARAVIDGRHQLWRLAPPEKVYDAPANRFWSAGFTPDDASFLAAVKDGGLDLVPLRGEGKTRHIPVPAKLGSIATLGASGREVVLSGQEGVARIDLGNGKAALIDAPGRASRIDLAPHGGASVLGYPDDRVVVLGAQDRPVARLRLSGALGATAFAADGRLVALGSLDGGVRLVDLTTGRIEADIRTDSGAVLKLTFLSGDDWLLVDGATQSSAVPLDPYSRLCHRAVRSLTVAEWIEVGGSGAPPPACP